MRLFFALWPPVGAARKLARIALAAASTLGGKATRQNTIHLTLAFLGEIEEAKLPLLIQTAEGLHAAPFSVEVDRLGYWRHNQLLWAGSASPSAPLNELVDTLRDALAKAGFHVDGEQRRFIPHLTLVRKLPEPSIPAARPIELPEIDPVRWRCTRFVLVRSQTADGGPSYEILADFPLSQHPH